MLKKLFFPLIVLLTLLIVCFLLLRLESIFSFQSSSAFGPFAPAFRLSEANKNRFLRSKGQFTRGVLPCQAEFTPQFQIPARH